MLYYADSANAHDVSALLECYPIDGATTNPTIVSRENRRDYAALLREMRVALGPDRQLFVQTLQADAAGMVREALALRDFVGGNFSVKIPITPDGLRATAELKRMGVCVTITAVFSAPQAILAAKAGADFIAPYVNKLDDLCANGPAMVADMVLELSKNRYDAKILAASFRNANQVDEVMHAGAQAVTLPVAFYKSMIWHPLTDIALKGFNENWSAVYGDAKPIDLIR